MSVDINSFASEALKTINNEFPNVLLADGVTANPGVIPVLAIALLVIYMGLMLSVGVPLNQGEVVNPDYMFFPVDDEMSHSGTAGGNPEILEINELD
ncbi:conserved Plasmodium protein, unknown function [Plasmodium knowlesi strain H]|uniref:Uncharacterized protein n=3 Tax=Plasmodium knowlesi TaxID=5850 RepID=A0A5K1TZU3_PLAKH|nr:conserved Plasmodium protein, unknown function [Plasmodium knowlesi strain H]OTN65549.1 Uncharacterized protein PKNOH_S110117200 [Plasmodium knowlesi]CAA9989788.1 conserved Plasmodium protein, unknown function [Plasmodium knowlesi strain H]SBO22915.1 conserved Plasmodium protein, unknown function [Plasmodium knowlesi strain H]SBO22982.1 conserved Plasmodium protein, unknown function [Plasmodium knowlesi strain H]VVS79262.1 conserved Plasmodium protein, unknown function [Plasmodium knowlesi |eukprot:XP_002260511.1 hypothetical protein, conserved in Plasmodium species [Plasmodium knowlesi strain H]